MATRRERRKQQRRAQRRNDGDGGGAGRGVLLAAGVGLVALIAVIGVVAANSNSGGGGGSTPSLSAAPDFRLSVYQGEEALGGAELGLSQVTSLGKPVVLNFWAGLCPPCRAEMPGFQRVYDARRDEVTLLGVDVGPFTGLGSREDGIRLLKQLGITYPIAAAQDARAVQVYRVLSMPTTVFITPDGRIQRKVGGAISERQMNGFIDELVRVSQVPVEAS